MIPLSTLQPHFLHDQALPVEQALLTLSAEDEEFYNSIKDELDQEHFQPSAHTIASILAYSGSLKK